MSSRASVVRLGYEVGTGKPVDIPLAHTFVTGQTQLSGKTTTLRAIVERSERRALAFVTKRGESFDGRRVRPYLPREGDAPIHWRLVETILAAALGQRSMKYERLQLVTAVKSPRVAMSLQGVRDNVAKLQEKAKGQSGDIYLLIGEYLDLVLPEMRALGASDELVLDPGLNVMDLSGVGTQLQSLIIRACLEHINRHESQILTVFPEAWEFAPRGTNGPAKEPAIAMARKGSVLGNFLLCDSQDIAGVDTVVRQAASVWILGVQRELNELQRTIKTIPAGIKRPKAEDVATLPLGQFYACWGTHAVKTYVQPPWMDEQTAVMIATTGSIADYNNGPVRPKLEEPTVKESEARELLATNERLERENADLRRRLDALESKAPSSNDRPETRTPVRTPEKGDTGSTPVGVIADEDELYLRFKARLVKESPAIIRVLATKQEINVEVERRIITMDGSSMPGRLARLIAARFFREIKRHTDVRKELDRTGPTVHGGDLSKKLVALVKDGFLTDEGEGYREVEGMLVNVMER